MSDFFAGKVVLITGASSGIGEALAAEAVERGANVVLAARRGDRLAALVERFGKGRSLAVVCDVTRETDLADAVQAAHTFGPVDVVIANAGFARSGRFENMSLSDYEEQFDTNVYGVIRTIRQCLPDLKRTRGAAAVVGSANGYLSLPGYSAYCMSKHAVRSLCACLRHELSGAGVRVTHLVPGFIQSEFRHLDEEGNYQRESKDPIPDWLVAPTRPAARSMLTAIAAGKEEHVITGHAHFISAMTRLAPRVTSTAVGLSGGLIRRWGRVR